MRRGEGAEGRNPYRRSPALNSSSTSRSMAPSRRRRPAFFLICILTVYLQHRRPSKQARVHVGVHMCRPFRTSVDTGRGYTMRMKGGIIAVAMFAVSFVAFAQPLNSCGAPIPVTVSLTSELVSTVPSASIGLYAEIQNRGIIHR